MKVVICGGGTSGWLSALFLSHIHPKNEYILIESSEKGVIGTGEGSTGAFTGVVKNQPWRFNISEEEFVKETGATPKLGIEFKNWGSKNYIASIEGSMSRNGLADFYTIYSILNDLPPEHATIEGLRAKDGRICACLNDNNSSITPGGAYHFDGVKVSKFLKKHCPNVQVIDDIITDLNMDKSNNIKTLICKSNTVDNIDLIIDCLGLDSVIANAVDKGWIDYGKYLPVNSAVVFQRPNEDLDSTKALTISTAMKYGWMFEIPVDQRYGCGYVYCDKYCTEEEIVEELESSGFEVKGKYRKINFKSGRVKHFWKNNVVSLGLSSGFLEPLQATSLHTTIAHLNILCFQSLVGNKIKKQQAMYNRLAARYFDHFADFVNLHYQCDRDDTEFWKYMTKKSATPYVKDLINLCKDRVPALSDYEKYTLAASGLWNTTLHGLGLISKENAQKQWEALEGIIGVEELNNIEDEYQRHQINFNKSDVYLTNSSDVSTMKEFMLKYHFN